MGKKKKKPCVFPHFWVSRTKREGNRNQSSPISPCEAKSRWGPLGTVVVSCPHCLCSHSRARRRWNSPLPAPPLPTWDGVAAHWRTTVSAREDFGGAPPLRHQVSDGVRFEVHPLRRVRRRVGRAALPHSATPLRRRALLEVLLEPTEEEG